MTIKRYQFSMAGTGAEGKAWETAGEVDCDWTEIFDHVMRTTFAMLSDGRATYGEPGPCGGPYNITEMHVEQVQEKAEKIADHIEQQVEQVTEQTEQKQAEEQPAK